MNFDISHLLEHWDYQPGQVVVRKFVGKDGQEKIQLRVDLGILQMNALGRPDGKRPFGHASLFDFYMSKLQTHRQSTGADDEAFTLKAEDCARLQMEAFQYHHRYICLLQLEDFAGALRDTARNLKFFDFVDDPVFIADGSTVAFSTGSRIVSGDACAREIDRWRAIEVRELREFLSRDRSVRQFDLRDEAP